MAEWRTSSHPKQPSFPNIIEGYLLIKEIGKGGQGVVYEVEDAEKNKFALKLILVGKNKDLSNRLESCCKALMDIKRTEGDQAKGIVTIHSYGEFVKEHFCIVMEYLDNLSIPCSDRTLLDYSQVKDEIIKIVEIARDISDALFFVHKKNLIHRDIKPENIMMRKKIPVLIDFDLVKDTNHQLQTGGGVKGTLAYMPPEQKSGKKVTPLSDIYSLGATLYSLLKGTPPSCNEKKIMFFNLKPPKLKLGNIPKSLKEICRKCLDEKPSNRYKNAKSLSADLDNFVKSKKVNALRYSNLRHFSFITLIGIGLFSLAFVSFRYKYNINKHRELLLEEKDLEVKLRQYYSRISFEEEQYIEVSAQRANPFGPRKRDYKTFTVTKGSDYQYKFHEISVHSQSNETSYDVTPYKDKDEIPRGVHITALATGPYWNDIKAGHKWLKFTCTVKFVYSDQKIEALLQEKIKEFREALLQEKIKEFREKLNELKY